jgi:hypothetical protein
MKYFAVVLFLLASVCFEAALADDCYSEGVRVVQVVERQ